MARREGLVKEICKHVGVQACKWIISLLLHACTIALLHVLFLVNVAIAQPLKSSVTLRREGVTVRVYLQDPTIHFGGIFLLKIQVTIQGEMKGDEVRVEQLPPQWAERVILLSTISDIQTFERAGQKFSTMTFNYRFAPLQPGRVKFDGIRLIAFQKAFHIPPIEGIAISGAIPREEAPISAQPVRVTASVSTMRPFVGEQVVYTLTFASLPSADIHRPTYEPPKAEGFLTKEFPKVARKQQGGYDVQQVRLALFPLREGILVIDAAKVTVQLRDEPFPTEFRTPTVNVVARPMPQPMPMDFQNLVGTVKARIEVNPKQVSAGDVVTVRLLVEGTANLQNLNRPHLSLPNTRVSIPRDNLSPQERGGKLWMLREIEWRIVPMQEGKLTIPPFRITYFDPQTKSYKTASTPSLTVTVLPGQKLPATVVAEEPPDLMAQVLPFVIAALIAFAVAVVGLRYWQRHRLLASMPISDPQLKRAVLNLQRQGSKVFVSEVRSWLREQIYQRTGVLLAPTEPPERVQQLLMMKGVSEAAARFAREVWERTSTSLPPDEAITLLQQVTEVPQRL